LCVDTYQRREEKKKEPDIHYLFYILFASKLNYIYIRNSIGIIIILISVK